MRSAAVRGCVWLSMPAPCSDMLGWYIAAEHSSRSNQIASTRRSRPIGGRPVRLKPSAYLMLGMLRAGIGTGYAIKRAVDQSTRFFWSTSFAQVYPELAHLEEDDYIAGDDDPHGGRPRRTYRVTKKGERALEDWLRSQRPVGFE